MASLLFLSMLSAPVGAVVTVDTDDEEVMVQFPAGEMVDLKVKAEPGRKIWVKVEAPELFPGIQFARPSDGYAREKGRYLIPFSVNNQLTAESQELYFDESFDRSQIDFGTNDFSGLVVLIIFVLKGDDPDNLEPIQTIRLVESEDETTPGDNETDSSSPPNGGQTGDGTTRRIPIPDEVLNAIMGDTIEKFIRAVEGPQQALDCSDITKNPVLCFYEFLCPGGWFQIYDENDNPVDECCVDNDICLA
jgi:hypothetical protein